MQLKTKKLHKRNVENIHNYSELRLQYTFNKHGGIRTVRSKKNVCVLIGKKMRDVKCILLTEHQEYHVTSTSFPTKKKMALCLMWLKSSISDPKQMEGIILIVDQMHPIPVCMSIKKHREQTLQKVENQHLQNPLLCHRPRL